MALGNIFEEETRGPDGLIFVDKNVEVKCYYDDAAVELAVCGGLSINKACQALQRLVDI